MAKKPPRSRVDASLTLKMVMIRGCDLTLAGTILGVLSQHKCSGVVRVGEESVPADTVLSVVALNIQPQTTIQITITGRDRHGAARHLATIQQGRWVTIFGD